MTTIGINAHEIVKFAVITVVSLYVLTMVLPSAWSWLMGRS